MWVWDYTAVVLYGERYKIFRLYKLNIVSIWNVNETLRWNVVLSKYVSIRIYKELSIGPVITVEVIFHCAFRMKCLYCSHLVWKINQTRSCCSTLCKVQEQEEQYYSQLPGFTSLSLCYFFTITHPQFLYIYFLFCFPSSPKSG